MQPINSPLAKRPTRAVLATALLTMVCLPVTNPGWAGSPPVFEARTIETEAVLWWARALGDVNGNGLTDVLLQDNNGHGGMLRWYETREGGTTWAAHVIAERAPNGSPFAAGDLAAADINNNGHLDVLGLAHPGEWKQAGAPTEIYWYENPMPEGDPTKDAWQAHHIGRAPACIKDVALADFTGNGRVDLVAITFVGNRFLVFRQDSPTEWTKVQDFVIPNLHEGLDVGDITGNGLVDVATNGYWVENPGGDLTGEWTVRSIDERWHNQTGDWSRNATKVFCRDITGDGRVEVFISHSERAGYPVSWYRAEDPRTGPWKEHVITRELVAAHTLQVYDFNGNGHYDVLAGSNAGRARALGQTEFPAIIFLNQGDNQTWEPSVLTKEGIYNGQVADLTGNGAPDVFRLPSHDASLFEVLVNQTPDRTSTTRSPLPWQFASYTARQALDRWTYIEVDAQRRQWGDFDEPSWMRYFGLDTSDFTGNGYRDIVSGRYFYRNPGGEMTGDWERIDLGLNVDGCLFVDVEQNGRPDIIAMALPHVYWLKADDAQGTSWTAKRIASGIPRTPHVNGQGYVAVDITGNGRPEILLASGAGIYSLSIPDEPADAAWPAQRIAAGANEEGIAVGDMNGNGRLDVVAGYYVDTGGDRVPGANPRLRWNNARVVGGRTRETALVIGRVIRWAAPRWATAWPWPI